MSVEHSTTNLGDYHGIIPPFEALKDNQIRYYHFKQMPGDAIWAGHEMIHYVFAPVCLSILSF